MEIVSTAPLSTDTLDLRYLNEASNLSDLDNAGTARTNLGLIAGGGGDIWVEKAGDTMTGALTINTNSTILQALNTVGKIAQNGTQVLYLPDQTDFTGTLYIGNGGEFLSHVTSVDGFYNTYVGIGVGLANTTGNKNTAIGWNALTANTTGTRNFAMGHLALSENTTGYYNTAMGYKSLCANISGYYNTGIGLDTFHTIEDGHNNTALGHYAGVFLVSGSFNTFLGSYSDAPSYEYDVNNSIGIGYKATTTESNQLVIGSNIINAHIAEGFFGSGVASATPLAFRLNATAGLGTNKIGAELKIAGGRSTGSGEGGVISFQTSPSGSSGSDENAPVTAMTIDINGNVGIGITTPTAKLHLAGNQYINTNSTTALVVEQNGVNDNTLVVDTTNGRVDVGGREVIELFRYSFMLGR